MSTMTQILLGSLVVGVCSAVHIALIIGFIGLLKRGGRRFSGVRLRWVLIAGAFAVILLGHTAQVWIWAGAFLVLGALPEFGSAIYFALTTYTTVGYGDITVGRDFRIFAAMAAVTGFLSFGLSTAFLVELMSKVLAGQPQR